MRNNLLAMFALLFSAAPSAQQPARWRLVEEWRVGGEPDGAHSFNDVRAMRALGDGRLVVLEFKDQQVHLLDARGQLIRTVGRKGAGPGEFQQANGLVISPAGEIVVNDPSNVRFTVFSSTGDLVRTVRYQNWGFGYYWDGRYDADGRLNEQLSFRRPGDTANIQGRRVWSRDLSTNDTIPVVPCPNAAARNPRDYSYAFRTARGGGYMTIPFVSPRIASVTGADGYAWIGTSTDFSTIERRAPGKCDAALAVRLAGPRVAVPKAERDAEVESVLKFAARFGPDVPDLGKIPRELPYFDALYIDTSNRLWVERRPATGPRRFEVFSATGRLTAALDIPVPISGYHTLTITEDRVYLFTSDADGVQYLVALRIMRS